MTFDPFFFMRGKLGGSQSAQSQQQVAYLRQLQREMRVEETLNIPLTELNVIVFDIETTGFYPDQGDQIISIGAIKVKGDEIKEEETFYSLVRSEKPISNEISSLTGLTNEQLTTAPLLSETLFEFFRFAQDYTLVAHHANHEKMFLQHASWKLYRSPFKHRLVDMSFLYRIAEPGAKLITLEECCKHNGIPIFGRHHALEDAKLTAQLWSIYVNKLKRLGCETLKDLYERYTMV
ncbi:MULTISPECIES: exonuclease domain-containing protein [Bacillaceae]|uniref:exonuclease domain-containing protein n=1 Tax=Bacillaceae TaxID=186817 RepID=UPI000BFB8395|nr:MULTISPECIES: exonuclease domain-containing protein [Bacillaceae]PGT81715.1 DNA polymerase III subunit epsilon [Bacillus sp. AFS040349]UGB32460.1 3'-5' exoribonuclease [Metabacillus sp. B2-18]